MNFAQMTQYIKQMHDTFQGYAAKTVNVGFDCIFAVPLDVVPKNGMNNLKIGKMAQRYFSESWLTPCSLRSPTILIQVNSDSIGNIEAKKEIQYE